ncbi:glycoside hydrolase family 13 protein, partial [Podospora conica]
MALVGQRSRPWWKEAIIYQIYPASFLDTNGDGWGDINGITSKLDYLKGLGVDVLWLSPIYESPMADMGYDISNYQKIHAPYGDMDDVDRLIRELKARDMKLIMDLVVNHTSNQHAWFLESRSSTTNPKRDWYIWKKPLYDADGNPHPPNNWGQILGEANSAWIYDDTTQEYYLAIFTPEQPDLNWENPAVRAAVHDILRFWLDRGVAGFRMDVINLISKHPSFPDAEIVIPGERYQPGTAFFANGPRLHEFLGEIKTKVLDTYPHEVMTVGEMPFVPDERDIVAITHQETGFLNMVFNFDLCEIDACRGGIPGDFRMSVGEWEVADLRAAVVRWQRLMAEGGGWNSVYCENHDQPRSVSHFCDDSDEWRTVGSKLMATMETTLCGTLFVYQGEELGMRNLPREWGVEEYKDVESGNFWKKVNQMYPGDEAKLENARKALRAKARDNTRTPVQWTSDPNAGFCPPDVKPWMRVNDDYPTVNAATQLEDGQSVYRFWQRMLKFRKERPEVFVHGDFDVVDGDNKQVFAYARVGADGERWIVALNFTGKDAVVRPGEQVEWEVGNYFTEGEEVVPEGVEGGVRMRPWEGMIGR